MTTMYGSTPFDYDFASKLASARASAVRRPRASNGTEAERDVSISLPVFAASATTLGDQPNAHALPTRQELDRHIRLFGTEGTEGLRRQLSTVDTTEVTAAKSEQANLRETQRKRSRRRAGVKDQVAALLARKPDLLPAAIADQLNLSDRRVKQIIDELTAVAA